MIVDRNSLVFRIYIGFTAAMPLFLIFFFVVHGNELLIRDYMIVFTIGFILAAFLLVSTFTSQTRSGGSLWGNLFNGYWVPLFPLTPLELMDDKKREITVSLSADDAFELCTGTFSMMGAELKEQDLSAMSILAVVDMAVAIRARIVRIDPTRSQIQLEGWVANQPILQSGENLFAREQITRETIRVLDHLQKELRTDPARLVQQTGTSGGADVVRSPQKSERTAALLSAISPGAGQMYCGDWKRAAVILALTVFGIIFYLVPGIFVWVYGIADAAGLARKVNSGELPFIPTETFMIILQIACSAAIIVYSIMGFLMVAFGLRGYEAFTGFFGLN